MILQHDILVQQIIVENTAKWWENVTKKGGMSYPQVLQFTARVIREVHVLLANQSRIINDNQ